jgi:branched-chain amino acid transport system ATP-binding protein
MLEISNLTVTFGGVVALSNVSATFTAPVAGIIGPNGAGKTTLMNALSGFVTPRTGTIVRDGQNLLALPPYRRAQWGLRRSFQKEEIADDLTVFDNVLVQIDHVSGDRRSKIEEVERMLTFVGMQDRMGKPGRALNSFERRLTDVAKCLVGKPHVVMFDEPAGGLTAEETRRLGDLITRVHAETGAQTLLIDHDVELIRRICSETLVLDFGKRVAFGPTEAVLADAAVQAAYLGETAVDMEVADVA